MTDTPQSLGAPVLAERRVRVMEICRSLPEATVEDVGHLKFQVRGRTFAYFLVDHHGDGRVAIHCKADSGVNPALAAADPERFSIPPYLGHRGWLGIWLDVPEVDWEEIAGLLFDAYCLAAPKRLARQAKTARMDEPGA